MTLRPWTIALVIALVSPTFVRAQEPKPAPGNDAAQSEQQPDKPVSEPSTVDQLKKTQENLTKQTKDEVGKLADVVDHDLRAKTAAAGILQPIYLLAEKMSFPAFHWLAFALMSAGVVSYSLQLALGKLVVLTRMGFSLKEIMSDAVGLAISVVGLVLTTQAAAENSTFTQSPTAVLSAAALGIVVGIILYFWGQSQELQAAAGRSRTAPAKRS